MLIELILWLLVMGMVGVFIIREISDLSKRQKEIEETRQQVALTQARIDQELGRGQRYVEINGTPHVVTDREVRIVECDIGITICVAVPTETTSLY